MIKTSLGDMFILGFCLGFGAATFLFLFVTGVL